MNKESATNYNPNNDCSHIPNNELFQTGDVLLFSDKKFIPSLLIEDLTHSKYSHVGTILKDPIFPNETLEEGLYILQATGYIDVKDVENNCYTNGVQINKLSSVYDKTNGDIYWRRLTTDRNQEFLQIVSEVHKITHNKDYDFDPDDWIKSYFDWHYGNEQKENAFVCSALISFLYDRLGFLKKPNDWTLVRPVDWGTEYPLEDRRIHIENCQLDSEIQIKFMKPKDPIDVPESVKVTTESSSIWKYLYSPIDWIIQRISK